MAAHQYPNGATTLCNQYPYQTGVLTDIDFPPGQKATFPKYHSAVPLPLNYRELA
jgi:hypothetical protein